MAANFIYGRKIPRRVLPTNDFVGGIQDFEKSGGSYLFGRSIDYRTDPRKATILPAPTKESGSLYTALPKWGERVQADNNTYIYDAAGNLYKRTTAGSHSLLRTVSSSHGNGLSYFGEDDFLYYTSDKLLGRYGPLQGTPTFTDDYLGSQGGNPTNTYSALLASASSQYFTAADSASLSITGNLTLEQYVKPTTLPTVGNTMALIAKWDESTNHRSYKFDITAISGVFGTGADGALTISVDTTDAPIDSAATATINTNTISATNGSFAVGQVILLHQTQGTGAGTYQKTSIQSYTAGTITTTDTITATYGSGAQVLVLKQYSSVTVNAGKTWTAKTWNGTTGGILSFLCQGTLTVTGNISANACGFRGGTGAAQGSGQTIGQQGEGTVGTGTNSTSANGNGGGGGNSNNGGSGGGNAATGSSQSGSTGGNTSGSADLTTMTFGGGGGGGGNSNNGGDTAGNGGVGGGIIFILGTTIIVSGGMSSNGGVGTDATVGQASGGGGGAEGSVLLKTQVGTLNSNLINSSVGGGGNYHTGGSNGVSGGIGYDVLNYLTSYTGTTTPTLNAIQDNTLVTTTSYQLRLSISNDGTALEILAKIITISTASWGGRLGVSWTASTSTAIFYVNGVNQGSVVGTKTAIHDNTSLLYIGADKGASVQDFLDARIDDTRIWNVIRTSGQMSAYKDVELVGTETGLVAYYKHNNAATDATANANNLTAVNAPTYSVDVPFSNATTRLDIDQTSSLNGQTYTTPTTIDESTSNARLSFTPKKDPQKSIAFNFGAKGTGDVTLTIHDGINRVILSMTVTNANLPASGNYEFVFSSVWRPVVGQTYHAHLTSTVADATLVTGTVSNLNTATFTTYYQFLVSDVDYHPMERMLNFEAIGNERYVATWDGGTYTPHKLKFPAGWRVRCLTTWHEFLAIGCWKGTNIYDFDEGIIFFWDGFSQTYNTFIEVPEGGVNAMFSTKGALHVWAGYQGEHLIYTGGDAATKVKKIPKITAGNYMEIMPGAVTMWRSLIREGIAGNSDSSVVERGVYTYGSSNKSYPDSLSYDFPISTGNRLSTVKIGMLTVADKKLLIGWQDNTSYGVDVVNLAGNPYTTATMEGPIVDIGLIWKEKQTIQVRADFLPLLTGESVDVKYKFDRESSWHSALADSGITPQAVGDTTLRYPIPAPYGRHKEVQVAVDLTGPGTSAPTLLEFNVDEDFLLDEAIV